MIQIPLANSDIVALVDDKDVAACIHDMIKEKLCGIRENFSDEIIKNE
jgi:hypothetical protein